MPVVYTYVYILAINNCLFTSQPYGVLRPRRIFAHYDNVPLSSVVEFEAELLEIQAAWNPA